jgi:hypothetical protein
MDERFVGVREFHDDVHRHSAFSSVFFQRRSKLHPQRPNESQGEHEKYCAEKYRNADHPNHAPTPISESPLASTAMPHSDLVCLLPQDEPYSCAAGWETEMTRSRMANLIRSRLFLSSNSCMIRYL